MGKDGGLYTIGFPQEGEYNGNGTACPGIALPGETPWRTITIGQTLAPIVETTIPYDVVEPLYEPSRWYVYGRGTWSWIIGGDNSMNYDEQKRYVDFAGHGLRERARGCLVGLARGIRTDSGTGPLRRR